MNAAIHGGIGMLFIQKPAAAITDALETCRIDALLGHEVLAHRLRARFGELHVEGIAAFAVGMSRHLKAVSGKLRVLEGAAEIVERE